MCACLDESGLCLSMLIYLLSISCFYFSLDFISPACSCFYFSVLLPLFFESLVRLASLGSLFFRFGHVSPCSAWPVLRGGLAALCLVSQLSVWWRGALLRRLGHRRCECEFDWSSGSLASQFPRPLPLRSRHRGTLRLSVVNLAPRWEGGMVGVRNERQTHLPSPPVWTAPLRSSLSSPSRGIVARVI